MNVGGIANLSALLGENELFGYDLGPGNCLMDAWILRHQGQSYDVKGQWASQGKVITPLLQALLEDPFFKKHHPKSIGKEYFSLHWLSTFFNKEYQAVDVQATLLHLTAELIAKALISQKSVFKKLILCGGGAHNEHLLSVLTQLMPEVLTRSSAAVGIDPDFIEAQMMGWLAHQMMMNHPCDLKPITGAYKKALLGVFYPPGIEVESSNL